MPSNWHPPLRLHNEVLLRKPGYIRVDKVHVVHRDMLQLYDWRKDAAFYKMDGASYATIAHVFEIETLTVAGETHSVFWLREKERMIEKFKADGDEDSMKMSQICEEQIKEFIRLEDLRILHPA